MLMLAAQATTQTQPADQRAPSSQLPITLIDDRGTKISFSAPPQRIVSMLPSLTESLCALHACNLLVGTDRFSNSPPSVVALPKLGGLDDAQIERIVGLRPDVVLLSTAARVIERLEALGVKVLVLESRNHADVKRSLQILAAMLGKPADGERVWASIQHDMASAAKRVPPSLRGKRVYFEVDATPYAAGASSFIGETLQTLGVSNAVAADLGPFPKLNPEHVVRMQPDIVMASEANLSDMPKRPGWSALRALKEGQRCGFGLTSYELLVRPGPRMGEAALILADCLETLVKPR